MTGQALQRHEIVFSMTSNSLARVESLLKRCGHQNMNLLLARGLELVEFVLDQVDLGRVVGSVIVGESEFMPLRERPELLKPSRARQAPASTVGEPAQSSTDAVAGAFHPKLVARPRVPVEEPTEERLPRARRLFKHAAFAVNDDAGPVRSLAFHLERSESMGLERPIDYNGHALPGELRPHHLDEIQQMMDAESMATHFLLCEATEELSYFGYFPNTGWHRLNADTRHWTLDTAIQAGERSLYPMDLAAFYLRRQADKQPEQQLQA
ncbi:hypothetical protein [Pseudomonas sp. MPR-ANC1]|uniref:hypothetical protein n=2 Tax=unclassified Pseudomonas TaxID=196821 RepID=UPI000CD01A8A|nr:hypothetical protein [Pseudomonas sp. MPR-ANC1]